MMGQGYRASCVTVCHTLAFISPTDLAIRQTLSYHRSCLSHKKLVMQRCLSRNGEKTQTQYCNELRWAPSIYGPEIHRRNVGLSSFVMIRCIWLNLAMGCILQQCDPEWSPHLEGKKILNRSDFKEPKRGWILILCLFTSKEKTNIPKPDFEFLYRQANIKVLFEVCVFVHW